MSSMKRIFVAGELHSRAIRPTLPARWQKSYHAEMDDYCFAGSIASSLIWWVCPLA